MAVISVLCLCVHFSIHKRFQEIDSDMRELSAVLPLEVRVPHDKILSMPEFRVILRDIVIIQCSRVYYAFSFRCLILAYIGYLTVTFM